jgi:hypothetical protein
VSNCEDTPLKILKIVDWRLRIYKWFWRRYTPTLTLQPGEQIIFTKDDPGFERLDQPNLCRCRHICSSRCLHTCSRCRKLKTNIAWVLAYRDKGIQLSFSGLERDKDPAVVKCEPAIVPAPKPEPKPVPYPICNIISCPDYD